jgi:hypothetical protein
MSQTTTATVKNGVEMNGQAATWCPLESLPAPEEEEDMSKLPNRVADMLAGRSILITGGTGFMGKVLLEKILRSCGDVDTIYLLIRNKKGKEPRQRVEEIFASPVSDRSEQEWMRSLHSANNKGILEGSCPSVCLPQVSSSKLLH